MRHLRAVLEYDQERGIRGALSMAWYWWVIIALVVFGWVWTWCACTVAKRALEAFK